jgi:ligand-binding sensor domain-containing protein/signal transduction histidine kinase
MTIRILSFVFPVFIFLILHDLSFAQSSDIEHDNITLEQGLSQSTVFAITQDAQGFMWFGTQDGLNRYDGYSVKVFRHNPANSKTIGDNSIRTLLCDSRGDLWIGTENNGLDRYVSKENRFYHFVHNYDNSTLSNNSVTSLYEDFNKNIWVGTGRGLNLLDKGTGKFRHFSFGKDSSKLNNATIWGMSEDKKGNLWLAASIGLLRVKMNDLLQEKMQPDYHLYQNSSSNPGSISANNVTAVCFDRNEVLWASTVNGVNRLDENTNKFTIFKHDPGNPNSLPGDIIISMKLDSQGELWMAAYDAGLIKYNAHENKFERYIDDALWTVYEDNSGILWTGTYSSGVKILNRKKNRFRLHHSFYNANSINSQNNNIVFSVFKDSDSDIWIGTYGNGLIRIDHRTEKITKYTANAKDHSGLSSSRIFSLAESPGGKIWIGTEGGGLNCLNKKTGKFSRFTSGKDKENSLIQNEIQILYYDSKLNSLWMGYLGNGLSKFNLTKKKFTHFPYVPGSEKSFAGSHVTSIYRGCRSGLLVGTMKSGLFHFPDSGEMFERINIPGANLTEHGVHSLYEENSGILWIGTIGYGLLRYDPKTKALVNFKEEDGLPNSTIYSVLPDQSGNLWLSTNKGISKFNPATKVFKNYDKNDGLQSDEFNSGAYYEGSDHELIFGGINGFNAFYPQDIQDNKFVPPVYFTTFRVFNEALPLPNPIPAGTRIELSHSQNFLSFEFVGLNYTSPQKNIYAYRMEGFDKEWHVVPASQRFASYTNLNPGEYVLHVKASNNDGVWNEAGATLVIKINPPFWMTWWFRISVALFILTSVIFAYNYRVRKIRQIDLTRLRIARDLHDEVGSDLGGIALITQRLQKKSNLPGDIKDELGEINIAAFQTAEKLRDIVWFVNPEHDDAEHLILRLKDLAGRLLKDQEYTFHIDGHVAFQGFDLDSRRQLYLIIKEVLYNIVKHAEATKVNINIRQDYKCLQIIISDNGKGFSISADSNFALSGMGLKNIKRRAENMKGKLEIETQEGCGTTVTLTL